MKILNFGSLNIDKVYQVKDFVRPGETISSKKLDFFCGGKGLNQSIAISRAGAPVYHAGCIGYDGDMLSDALTASHIHTEYLRNKIVFFFLEALIRQLLQSRSVKRFLISQPETFFCCRMKLIILLY